MNDKISKGFNKSMMTGMILIDLQKAFGTIDHDTIDVHCKSYLLLISWNIPFKSYLSIRSFLVNLGNNFSRPSSEFEKWRAIRASVGNVGGVLMWVAC